MRWPLAISCLCLYAISVCAQHAHWLDVPFVKQPEEGCGAASIAMVMQYWHRADSTAKVSDIQQALFSRQAHGIYASEMQHYFEQNGYQTFVFHGDQALLTHHIDRGRPLIVALKPGSSAQLHYEVVAGVDPGENAVLVNDPAQRKLMKVDARAFEHEWKATGNWTLLAVPRSGTP